MKTLIIIAAIAAFFMSGCSSVQVKGADVADQVLQSHVWYVCSAATVGSVKRQFAGRMDDYNEFCKEGRLEE